MRSIIFACLFVFAATSRYAACQDTTPIEGYVSVASADVRSGPGQEFYTTGQLYRGDSVEIYREHTGGWLAIRPSQDAFAWVSADSLQLNPDSPIAEVTGDLVEAWVGSESAGVKRHLWQVRLDRGEQVELLGEQRLVTRPDRGRETWYKIAPPAGEFRFVHRDSVTQGAVANNSQVRQAGFSEPAQPRRLSQLDRSAAASTSTENTAQPAAQADAGELSQIDVALSLMVSRPIESWDLAALRKRVDEFADNSATPLDRGQARRLLEEITEFEDWRLRWRLAQSTSPLQFAAAEAREGQDVRSAGFSVAEEVGTGVEPALADAEVSELGFDGTGRLRKVFSRTGAAPPYVLVDGDNNVVKFVAPAPGLNLHRYLEKEVGIYGQQQRGTAFNFPLLTAQRVVRLDRHRE